MGYFPGTTPRGGLHARIGTLGRASDETTVLRILDANLNRLREALRVVEEYFRFVEADKTSSRTLKGMRHSLIDMEKALGIRLLVRSRDTSSDPLATGTRREEMRREKAEDVLDANMKRAQEAARVIEEYAKLSASPELSMRAKTLRFDLYSFQKKCKEAFDRASTE